MKFRLNILILSLFFLGFFAGCSLDYESYIPQDIYKVYTNGSGTVGSAGGKITVGDLNSSIFGASIEIPEGALSSSVLISISEASGVMVDDFPNALFIEFEPVSTSFILDVSIILPGLKKGTKSGSIYKVIQYGGDPSSYSELSNVSHDQLKNEFSFTTRNLGSFAVVEERGLTNTFTDSRDGKIYEVVTLGTQTWMAENLAYLPQVFPPDQGSDTGLSYYVMFYNGTDVNLARQSDNFKNHGVLYNWEAAKVSCPTGWHLPSDSEWTVLNDYLVNNGYGFEGSGNDVAKALASKHLWLPYSTGPGMPGHDPNSNNASGFNATPGGCRKANGSWDFQSVSALFWTSTVATGTFTQGAWMRQLSNTLSYLDITVYSYSSGLSVRCVKE